MPPVDRSRLREQAQQRSVAAAHVEHAGARLDHFGDPHEIDARLRRGDGQR